MSSQMFDVSQFSPVPAMLGGAMVGATGMAMLLFTGKTLGFSGITKALWGGTADYQWRTWFLGGLLGVSAAIKLAYPVLQEPLGPVTPMYRLLIGGLLVGLGTGLSNGCTSGHGIIGFSRFSIRSITATSVFLLVALITGSLNKVSEAFPAPDHAVIVTAPSINLSLIGAGLLLSLVFMYLFNRKKRVQEGRNALCSCAMGLLGVTCGIGLHVSGMSRASKIASFLDMSQGLKGGWDPSLLFVMVGAHAVALPFYHLVVKKIYDQGKGKSLSGDKFGLPSVSNPVDAKLVIGAALFGVGWGISALCPGPAHVSLFAPRNGDELVKILAFQAAMGGGWLLCSYVEPYFPAAKCA